MDLFYYLKLCKMMDENLQLTCRLKTEKPQLIAEVFVMWVATTYFPTTLVQYHRRCGA